MKAVTEGGPTNATDARAHIAALERWRDEYVNYLRSGNPDQRRLVIRLMPAAQDAMNAVDADLLVADPPALGPMRQTYNGLANLAFLHERPGFGGIGGGPTVYEGLLDVIEHALADLEREAERLERDAPQPSYCDRGHLVAPTPSSATPFCPRCGAPSIDRCPNCEQMLQVDDPAAPPSFCTTCGTAYPWVDREGRIHELQNMLSREDLDDATALTVREDLEALARPDLAEAEQIERWSRVKKSAPGLVDRGKNIVEGLVAAYIRQQVGL